MDKFKSSYDIAQSKTQGKFENNPSIKAERQKLSMLLSILIGFIVSLVIYAVGNMVGLGVSGAAIFFLFLIFVLANIGLLLITTPAQNKKESKK
jgi:uncharacterized membrane protein